MKTSKIVRQIKREAKSHPAKAAVLALLAVVAVCYWTSLAWSWVDDGKDKSNKSGNLATEGSARQNLDSTALLAAELAKIKAANQAEKNIQHGWKQLVEWIEEDPRTDAVAKMPGRADAFGTVEKQQVEEDEEEAKAQSNFLVVAPDVTPQSLDMSLSSTLVGTDGGVALIDGKAYRIGQIVISKNDQEQTPFVLSGIHARHVTLTHEEKNKKYELLLPEKRRTDNIQIITLTHKVKEEKLVLPEQRRTGNIQIIKKP